MGIGDDLAKTVSGGGEDGLLLAAERVLVEAKRHVPVGDPSADPDPEVSLSESGHVRLEGRSVVVVFDAPYAAKQHENQHLKHPRGGGPKFLENALKAVIPQLEGIVAAEVHKRMGGRPTPHGGTRRG